MSTTPGIVLPGEQFSLSPTVDAQRRPAVVLTISNAIGQAYIPLSNPDGVDELIERLTQLRDEAVGPRLVVPGHRLELPGGKAA